MTQTAPAPLLGVAGRWGSAEIELARQFDELHQLIYIRGGIRPSNAAVEEVAKLILIRLWTLRRPSTPLGSGLASDLFDRVAEPAHYAEAFAAALADPELRARDPAGATHPIWPRDEPFRLADPGVLARAARLVTRIVTVDRVAVSDPLGTAFDALLAGRYDHAGGLGTYLTPSAVARTMAEIAVDLLDPAGGTPSDMGAPGFGDPYCGTGRFLVALLELLRERDDALARHLLARGPFGADQSTAAVAKARINLLLYGLAHPLVWTVRDSVLDPELDRFAGQIPLLLTNPPFGAGKYDDPDGIGRTTAATARLAGRSRIDPALAGLVRAVRLLAPGGVLGIVLPDGLIASPAFADLLPEAGLAACVSLPSATFSLSGTVAKTSAVFLVRHRRPRRVALARANRVGYLRQAGKAAPDPAGNDLPALAGLIFAGLVEAESGDITAGPRIVADDPLVAVVAADAVDPARLDPSWVAAPSQLTPAERGGTVALRTMMELKRAPRARQVGSPFVSVLHVDDLGTVDWSAAERYLPSTPGLIAGPGDVIVSLLNPAHLRATVIPDGYDEVHVSGEFGVFRASVDPYAMLGLLYSPSVREQLRPLGTGTSSSRRRIDADDVLGVLVPDLSDEDLVWLGKEIREGVALIDSGRRRLRATLLKVAPSAGGATC